MSSIIECRKVYGNVLALYYISRLLSTLDTSVQRIAVIRLVKDQDLVAEGQALTTNSQDLDTEDGNRNMNHEDMDAKEQDLDMDSEDLAFEERTI